MHGLSASRLYKYNAVLRLLYQFKMKFVAVAFVSLSVVVHLATADLPSACLALDVNARVECGTTGITATQCRAKGCCYDDTRPAKWCFQAPTDGNDCVGVSCQNGGTCVDGIYSFSCQCPSGYSGTYCDTALSGSNYIRWGRKTCGPKSSVIYTGQAAGPVYNSAGSGANFQCMPDTPTWLSYTSPVAWNSYIAGVEYEMAQGLNNVVSLDNNGGRTIGDNPAPCVACFAPGRYSRLMIPAKAECPAGWTQEYRGYLAAEAVDDSARHRSSYICLDEAPEVASGPLNQDQAVIYPVRVRCGSLPCSQYINGREVACVVCTR